MDEKKKNKAKVQILTSTLIFAIVFFIEIYLIVNMKTNYLALAIMAIAALVTLSFFISALIELNAENNKARSEQFENLYRSEKALYLMSKKNMEDILYRLERVERSSIVPTEEIVSAQKGIAKVIINRNRENAEAIMNSNDLLNERFDDFETRLKTNNREHIDETKAVNNENLQQFIEKQQEIIINLKDMELRLNSSIMQAQKMLAEQRGLIEHSNVISQPYIQSAPVQPAVRNEEISGGAVDLPEKDVTEALDLENILEENTGESTEPEEASAEVPESLDLGSILEEDTEEDIKEVSESGDSSEEELPETLDLGNIMEEDIAEVIEPEETSAEDVIESIEESSESEDSAEETIEEDSKTENVVEESVESSESEESKEETKQEEEVKEEKPAMPDLSDPNKTMSPDEIAALLANMTQDEEEQDSSEEENEDQKEEIVPDQMIEEISAEIEDSEPVPEEKPPMPDLSDPNKKMSPDEIAALFANM